MAFPVHCQQRHLGLSERICKMGRIRLSFSLQSCCKGQERMLGTGLRERTLVMSTAICLSLNATPPPLSPRPHCHLKQIQSRRLYWSKCLQLRRWGPWLCLEGLSQKGLRKRWGGDTGWAFPPALSVGHLSTPEDPALLPGHLQLHPRRRRPLQGSRTERQIPFLGHVEGREVAAAVGTDPTAVPALCGAWPRGNGSVQALPPSLSSLVSPRAATGEGAFTGPGAPLVRRPLPLCG